MPEGPEIRRAADRLEKAVAGVPLTVVWFAFEELKPFEAMLVGSSIERIETRGKAMLTHFSCGLTLYSHNQLYGLWTVADAGENPEGKRILRVRLETADRAILLYSASDIAILERNRLAEHPFLLRVGPDVLDLTLEVEQVRARLLSPRFCRRQLSGLLLDQAFLAGLGNYLRVEILWQAELAPHHRAVDLSEQQLSRLATALLAIPRLSYRTRGTGEGKAHHGATFRFRVFHRAGEACERCGGIIEKSALSSRPFYWCPHCQR